MIKVLRKATWEVTIITMLPPKTLSTRMDRTIQTASTVLQQIHQGASIIMENMKVRLKSQSTQSWQESPRLDLEIALCHHIISIRGLSILVQSSELPASKECGEGQSLVSPLSVLHHGRSMMLSCGAFFSYDLS